MSETELANYGVSPEAILATILYAGIGIGIMLLGILLVNKAFNLNIHRELVKEHNVAFGILFGCMSIAVAIIIAGTIAS
jgi:putative membrane protein